MPSDADIASTPHRWSGRASERCRLPHPNCVICITTCSASCSSGCCCCCCCCLLLLRAQRCDSLMAEVISTCKLVNELFLSGRNIVKVVVNCLDVEIGRAHV